MPRKPWRMRKVPKAVARNGRVRPGYELNRSRVRMVCTLGMSVTSMGSISVAMNSTKSTRLSGKRRKAKA